MSRAICLKRVRAVPFVAACILTVTTSVDGAQRAAQPASQKAQRAGQAQNQSPTKNASPQKVIAPQNRGASLRASAGPAKMPSVQFSKREEKLNRVKVGDPLPEFELPSVEDGKPVKIQDVLGKTATVVVFWKGDRRMAREQLSDLGPDVVEPFGDQGVAVVGIAVQETAESAIQALTKAGAEFTNFLDVDGAAFASVGTERLPRTYVLDPNGKIVWFDIEYSLTTRRELHQALRSLTEKK